MPKAKVRLAGARALTVDALELLPQPQRPEGVRVDVNPRRDGLHPGARAGYGGAALGGYAGGGAAEGAHRHRLAEARERLDPQPSPAHDPPAVPREPGVDDVGVGDVLEPAGDRVKTDPSCARHVGEARDDLALERAPTARRGHELRQRRLRFAHTNAASKASAAAA